eukprot:CAMPEP_0119493524 /NCGR_PEP_ID=MMETSP1344-20130328/17759_1 /TAXON_ID=236787 /ORGANISM="Florenciella parvula, Strain CCMP2471" /LENGTH=50 /DNA_ID=CAMNT_0007528957 /DNA_START=49 /DNA_END=198 /DNA_ORIENTATION=+
MAFTCMHGLYMMVALIDLSLSALLIISSARDVVLAEAFALAAVAAAAAAA